MPLQYTSLLAAPMPVSRARELLILEYGNHCFKCGRIPQARPLYVDHIVPMTLGGQHVYANYQLLCASCNSRKWTRVVDYRPGTRCLDIIRQTSIELEPERSRWVPRPRVLPRRDGEYEWISVEEAARRLRVSVSTIRRMIEATPPQLVGEREPVAPGSNRTRYRVRFEASMWPQSEDDMSGEASDVRTSFEYQDAPSGTTDAPALTMGLLEIISADRETMERQAERIAMLEREAGTLQGRVEAQQASIEQYIIDMLEQTERAVRAEAEVERLRRPWWKLWRHDA